MNEIEKRIATVWPGRPTTADVEAPRIADLRAVLEVTNALADRIEVQADITGQLGASFHALAARVSALETASVKCPSAPMTHEAAPSPAAALVERMAEAMHLAVRDLVEQWVPWSGLVEIRRERYRASARAALRVAAEGLLLPMQLDEWHDFAHSPKSNRDAIDDFVSARRSAALEACR